MTRAGRLIDLGGDRGGASDEKGGSHAVGRNGASAQSFQIHRGDLRHGEQELGGVGDLGPTAD
jgi:hypothetical protein